MWRAGQRLLKHRKSGQTPIIFHLGDHDPSGMDMTRDITDRLEMFTNHDLEISRRALNMDQIEEFNPPPNPAKITDSRAEAYIAQFGYESWELDALAPRTIVNLVRDAIVAIRDEDEWNLSHANEANGREELQLVSDGWDSAVDHLRAA